MPIIQPHCRPGGFSLRPEDQAHHLVCVWPDDCVVQWGSKGMVMRRAGGAYRTAYFEAFPKSPDTFIRGEGEDMAAAERNAFAKFQKIRDCPGHAFERRHWTNGGGMCAHCGMFSGTAFEPSTLCVVCAKPTCYNYGTDTAGAMHWYCETDEPGRPRDLHPSLSDKFEVEDEEVKVALDSLLAKIKE